MGTNSRVLPFTPVLTTSAYDDGDQMGAVNALPFALDVGNDSASLLSLTLIDKAKQNQPIDVLFFSDAPVPSSTDNTALAIPSADMVSKFLGVVTFAADDYKEIAGQSVASINGIGLLLEGTSGDNKTLHAVVLSRGTGTYAADSLVFKAGVLQD